jgi:hypothetical protein
VVPLITKLTCNPFNHIPINNIAIFRLSLSTQNTYILLTILALNLRLLAFNLRLLTLNLTPLTIRILKVLILIT